MRKGLTKFKKGFYFITEDIKAVVVDSNRDVEAFETLVEAWVRAFGIPQWAKKERVARQLAFLVGEPKIVDKASLLKPSWVRIKIACRDPAMINGVNNVYINGQGYRIRWEVEGMAGGGPAPVDNGGGGSSGKEKDNENNDGGDDDKCMDGDDVDYDEGEYSQPDGGEKGAGDEATDDFEMRQESPDDYPGWERVVRYAASGEMGEEGVGDKTQECSWISSYVKNVAVAPVITLPDEEDKEDEKEGWSMVACQSAKKQKTVKQPVIASRTSSRVAKDGVSMMQKAKERASRSNELTGTSNPFTILNLTGKDKLKKIASDAHVVLGGDTGAIDNNIDVLLAKEKAEAVLAENRDRIRKERQKKKQESDPESIGLAGINSVVSVLDEAQDGNLVNEHASQSEGEALVTPSSPLADFENQLDGEKGDMHASGPTTSNEGVVELPKRKRGRPRKK
jgi:hypothetical protein